MCAPAKSRRLPTVFLRLLLSALALAPTAPVAPPVTAAAVDAVVQGYRARTGLPGVAVAVTRGTTVVRAAGYGHTPSGTRVTAHTAMATASVSKSFTALAVLQLVEAGRVRLDAPVRTYLPEFTMADPRAAAVTVRQLLNQTSGMSDTTFRSFSGPSAHTLREQVALMRTAKLAAAPGTRWEYHNPNFQVAARLVEVVGGRPFDEYLHRYVFGPLGMADSRTVDVAADLPPSARGHLVVAGIPVAVPEPPAFGNGSGGVLSSAHDLAAWLIAQNNQGRGPDGTAVASAASIAASHTPSGAAGSYGLGWFTGRTAGGQPLVDHSGDLFTSTAYQALLPESGYGIAVMANTGLAYGDAQAIGERLIALVEGRAVAPAGTPLVAVDAVLLVLAAAVAILAGRGVRRASRRAAGRRPLPLLLLPLALTVSIHRVVGLLYRGRDVAWVQVLYLYPTFMVLLLKATVGGVAVFAARVARRQEEAPCG
jgi:CubicO group peptidase (beta-lactamase class C family)